MFISYIKKNIVFGIFIKSQVLENGTIFHGVFTLCSVHRTGICPTVQRTSWACTFGKVEKIKLFASSFSQLYASSEQS